MKTWLQNRIKEPSTWAGIMTFVGLMGVRIAPELKELIIQAGVAIGGIILLFLKEGKDEAPPAV